jgi:hypothetical protein
MECRTLFVYQGRISTEKKCRSAAESWKQSHLGDSCKLLIVGNGRSISLLMPFYGEEHGIIWLDLLQMSTAH